MIKKVGILCLALFISSFCSAQITWEKLFVKSNTDVFRSIQEVPSGGYIAAGYSSWWSPNDTDAYVVRLTANGDTLWTRTFDGGKKDLFYKVINTADGGFVFCGYKTYVSAASDAYYMKLDANGNLLWQFTYGGTGTERGQDIIQTADGGYAMCGYSNSGTGAQGYNAFLIKIDANGGQTWEMKYGGNGYDDANSVKEILPGGGFILAGQSTSSGGLGSGDVWLVRVNATGTQQWSQRIGTAANDNAEYIQIATSGGFIICGSTDGVGMGGDDGYIVKTDDLGVVQWFKTYGGSAPDDFHRIENTSDGGFIACGTTQSNADIISNIWLFKTDAIGDSTWAYTFGAANHDHGYSAAQTSDGGYILCGYTASFGFNYEDALVIKVDEDGLLHNRMIYTTVTALVTPVNGTCGSTNAVVTITVRNFGDTAVSTFPDTVIITGAINQTLGQTFTGTIVPPNFTNHTFTTTINTSAGGVFNFHCFTSNDNDVYPAMNWLDSTITINATATPPAATGDSTCGPGMVTLTATSAFTLDWFSAASGGVSLGTSSTYSTSISNTTTFYVQASNACGTSTRTPVTAYVLPVTPPANVFSAQRCGPGNVTLLASSGSPISWWDSPTGGTMLQGNINAYVANVTTTTTFYVEAGTGGPCPSSRVPVTATVNPLPEAAFAPNAPAVCLGDAFQFTNTTTGAIGYSWDFGDASGTSTLSDPSYTYLNTGSYAVRLIAVSNLNCYDTTIVTVNVNTAPQVSFSVASTTGCAPYTVTFVNSTTNATDYLWDFGDGGSTSILENPVYTYNAAGTYTVSLNATVGSCADADTIVNYITVSVSPAAGFNAYDVCLGNEIDFTNTSTGATGYSWDFGDGTGVSSLADPSYTFLSANTFTVTLIATDGTCNDTITNNVIVSPMPTANFTAANACLGNAIDFTNTSSGGTTFAWDFGDGTGASSDANPSYTYLTANTFTVTLIATDGACSDTITNDVIVSPTPTASFTSANACLGDAIDFTSTSSGATGFTWNFGDGTGNSSIANPSYTYQATGTFTVTHIAIEGSCTDTITGDVTVFALPVVDLGPDVITNAVTYQLDAGAGFSGYLWNNGATTQTITADTNGLYCVIVSDINNCSDTDCVNVTLDDLSIENISAENYFITFPNPAQDVFTVLVSGALADGIYGLNIYDAMGRLILNYQLTGEMNPISMADRPRGIYSIEIYSGVTSSRKKLILY